MSSVYVSGRRFSVSERTVIASPFQRRRKDKTTTSLRFVSSIPTTKVATTKVYPNELLADDEFGSDSMLLMELNVKEGSLFIRPIARRRYDEEERGKQTNLLLCRNSIFIVCCSLLKEKLSARSWKNSASKGKSVG